MTKKERNRQTQVWSKSTSQEFECLPWTTTAFERAEDKERAILAGFQQHLSKPLDVGALVAVVADIVEGTTRLSWL
jgi:CheY-like chemotaxis protein